MSSFVVQVISCKPSGESFPLQYLEVATGRPTAAVPKLLSRFVVSIEENVAFENAQGCQRPKAHFDHLPSQATTSILGQDSQVIQITTPTIVAAKDGSYQPRAVSGDQAEARIPIQVRPKLIGSIGLVQPHTACLAPKSKHCIQIVGRHGGYGNVHPIILVHDKPYRLMGRNK
jgi:hypothetical protein